MTPRAALRRRIIATPRYQRAVHGLRSPAAATLLHALARQIAAAPERAPQLHGKDARMLRTRSYGGYPALCVFYSFDALAVYLLDLAPYDELTVAGSPAR